jgi:hypothetical protein
LSADPPIERPNEHDGDSVVVRKDFLAGRGDRTAIEIAAADATLGLNMANDGFNGASASQLALDDADHAALLA